LVRVAVTPALPPKALEILGLLVPGQQYDAKRQTLIVQPGTAFKIGIEWKNENQARLAGLRWISTTWKTPGGAGQNLSVPVPVREGGFSIMNGAVVCLPEGRQATAFYTFEIPAGFPVGMYSMDAFTQLSTHWAPPAREFTPLPLSILCIPPAAAPTLMSPVERPYAALYPLLHDRQPFVWSERWFYRDMRLEGYLAGGETLMNFFACPQSRPGVYELTVRGEGAAVTSANNPADVWPYVELYLPGEQTKPAARAPINALKTREFRIRFTAYAPFDALLLKASAQAGSGVEPPFWMTGFTPGTYGKQFVTLRGAKLELERALFAK
jgi:hypothetical protein